MSLCDRVRSAKVFKEKEGILEDCFAGKDCLILSCGPSFNENDENKLRDFAKGKKVACIKQAQIRYSKITDFHFLNDNNLLKYHHSPETLKFCCSGFLDEGRYETFAGISPDVFFKIDEHSGDTISDCNFDDFEFSQTRRLGPGIMYETVLPTLLHMGFKTLYVIGWDYTTAKDGTLKHFYNESIAKKVLRNTGEKIAELAYKEKEHLIESTDKLSDYLEDRGIKMYLISKVSELSKKLERIEI